MQFVQKILFFGMIILKNNYELKKKMFLRFFVFLFIISFSMKIYSANIGSDSGYDIPRFVSLKSNEVNLRIGSSLNYPIKLQYKIKNFPIEIIDEYKSWRKVNDIEGNKGWIHKTLLKGDRFGIIKNLNKNSSRIYSQPQGKIIGEIGELNIIQINTCLIDWCKITYEKYTGWMKKENIWGVYNNEKINVPFYQPLIKVIWKINLLKK